MLFRSSATPPLDLAARLAAVAASADARPGAIPIDRAELPRVYGWIVTPLGRRRVKCLLDSGCTEVLMHSALAASLGDAWSPSRRGGPASIRQADGSSRPTAGTAEAVLQLGALEEPTTFTVFDVDCDADVILGYGWLRSHDLRFLYDSDQVCVCAERGCTSGRRLRLDVATPCATQGGPAAATLSVAELQRMLDSASLEAASRLPRPAFWRQIGRAHV